MNSIIIILLMAYMPLNFYFAYKDFDWYYEVTGGKSYIVLKLLGRNGFRYFQMFLSVALFLLLGYLLMI